MQRITAKELFSQDHIINAELLLQSETVLNLKGAVKTVVVEDDFVEVGVHASEIKENLTSPKRRDVVVRVVIPADARCRISEHGDIHCSYPDGEVSLLESEQTSPRSSELQAIA